ncbi:MAG: carbohydrate-binding protein [Clostridiales bacterium]|nr:carbohydrate-binding protein [Clostridiales bacterium]
MKKFALLAALIIAAALSIVVFADTTPISVPYSTPTVDGEIDELEWNRNNYIKMDESNCQAWAGEIGDKVTFYYYWDQAGLYCAAKVVDQEVIFCSDGDSPYGLDCFQIALNPGKLIDGGDQGIFFSMGVTDTGNVEVQRHNYEDGLITENCKGKGKQNPDGWQLELFIPWSEINVLDTKFEPTVGYSLDAIICLLDRDDDGGTTNAFKTVLPDGDVGDFTVASYALTLTLEEEKKAEDVLNIETEAAGISAFSNIDVTEDVELWDDPETVDLGGSGQPIQYVGGYGVGYSSLNDQVIFRNVDFGANGADKMVINFSFGAEDRDPATLSVYVDQVGGDPVATFTCGFTGGWEETFGQEFESAASVAPGVHDVYVVFTNESSGSFTYIRFNEAPPIVVETAAPETAAPAPAPAAAAPAPAAAAPAPAAAPVAAAAPAAAAPAAQTGDMTAVAVLAVVAALGTAVVVSKKH